MEFKAALVTGAADRLGRAMAIGLAKRGISVAVHYSSSESKADDTVKELKSHGVDAIALKADLLDLDQAGKLVARASKGLDMHLDVLINNASIFEYDNLETADNTSWDRHIISNLQAPFILTQDFAKQVPSAAIKKNEKTARAMVLNMVDQRVRKLTPEFMTYSLAKNALWTLTQTSAQGLAPNVRVNAIGPGPTLQGSRQSKEHFEGQRQATILQRGADTEDIVATMNYLLDANAVTGQLICVDGGQHLGWETPDVRGIE